MTATLTHGSSEQVTLNIRELLAKKEFCGLVRQYQCAAVYPAIFPIEVLRRLIGARGGEDPLVSLKLRVFLPFGNQTASDTLSSPWLDDEQHVHERCLIPK